MRPAPAEAKDIITRHAERNPKLSSLALGRARPLVEQGREQGFALLDGPVHSGMAAVGVIIPTLAPMASERARTKVRLALVRRPDPIGQRVLRPAALIVLIAHFSCSISAISSSAMDSGFQG